VLDFVPIHKGVGFNMIVKKMVMDMQATVKHVRHKLKTNAKYKEANDRHCHAKAFKEVNRMMVFLPKERFFVGFYSKLQDKKYDYYTIIKNINDNTYVINLPNDMSISKTFNIFDIYLYYDNKPLYPRK